VSETMYDLIVIGAGPGGYVAAIRAAELGMRVACIDKGWIGGTCLQAGCIPSKALLESSHRYHELQSGLDDHGIGVDSVRLDLAAMMSRKQRIVDTMTKGIQGLFKSHKVDFVEGTARVASPTTVRVESESGAQVLSGRRLLLATGSIPVELPDLPFDGRRILSSTEALSLPAVPERLAVVGAGAIGLELGSVWSRLGTQVHVIEFTDSVLPGMDEEIRTQVHRQLKRQGLSFDLATQAAGARIEEDGIHLRLVPRDGGEEKQLAFDHVLVAVGRRPYAAGLGLDEVGVTCDERGFVPVDADYRTNVESIYAIGDLTPGPMLAHKAESEAVVAVERMTGSGASVNYDAVPGVVYIHPEVASVGLTEQDAADRGPVRVGKMLFRANARAHAMDTIDGFVKIVADAETDRLLGVHIFGPQASHLIAEAVLALELSASAEDLARTMHAHPTLSEVLREAAVHVAPVT
jgi:dihydrolipoamide dehydrogenase